MAEQLAIDGGKPTVKRSDYKNWPIITAYDRKLIKQVLDTAIVAGGTAPQVTALEKEWAEYVGSKYCLTTCSGTAALHMALAACGVKPGDEVITAAFTFLASASCAIPGPRDRFSTASTAGSPPRSASRRSLRSGNSTSGISTPMRSLRRSAPPLPSTPQDSRSPSPQAMAAE